MSSSGAENKNTGGRVPADEFIPILWCLFRRGIWTDDECSEVLSLSNTFFSHASSSCHIVPNEWWSAAATAVIPSPQTLNQPYTRLVFNKEVLVRVGRRVIVTVPFQKRPTNDLIR